MRFPLSDFHRRYPDDAACLADLMERRYGTLTSCRKCKREKKYHRVKTRRCFSCQWCGHQLYPTKGTIFEKTSVSLKSQYLVMYLMTSTRSGVAAKEVERILGVSYGTAWRMCHRIRRIMGRKRTEKLTGHVEVDETYMGGKYRGRRGRGAKGKTPIFGIVERGGSVRAFVTDKIRARALRLFILENVEQHATISSDSYMAYKRLRDYGYTHGVVNHRDREYVRGDVHTQTIEGVWSRLKLSIRGTHVHVSKKHLQKYTDEFSFRYHRKEPGRQFDHLLDRVVLARQ